VLPNWLYTQHLVEHDTVALAAAHRTTEQVDPRVVARLRRSALHAASLPTATPVPWEQLGRAVSALAAVCPATGWLAQEHLATVYQLARTTDDASALRSAMDARALMACSGTDAVELTDPIVARFPHLDLAGAVTVVRAGSAAQPAEPARSIQAYVVRAALVAAAITGAATDLLRRTQTDAPPGPLGAAVTQLLTAQAAVLRGLSMLETLTAAGQDCAGTVSAAFHTTVRGGVLALIAALEHLLDPQPNLLSVAGPAWPAVRAMAAHPVLGGGEWNTRVAATLLGEWEAFEMLP